MKAGDLIKILELNPELDLSVSTTRFVETPYQYEIKKGNPEPITSYTVDLGTNTLELQGGTEYKKSK